jgi:hypothetical protein
MFMGGDDYLQTWHLGCLAPVLNIDMKMKCFVMVNLEEGRYATSKPAHAAWSRLAHNTSMSQAGVSS